MPYIVVCSELLAPLTAALKRPVGRDRVVGEDAAVAPAADAEPIGIGDAAGDGVVHAGEQIDDFLVAPVGVDGLLEGRAAPGAAAIVHLEHGIAVGGEELALELEAVLVLAVGAAVDVEDQRQLLPAGRTGWLGEQAVDDGAVLRGEGDVLGAGDLQSFNQASF